MDEMEQKTMQEMTNDAAECISAECAVADVTDDDLDGVSGGRSVFVSFRGGTTPIYDSKGRICGRKWRKGGIYYYKCPSCGGVMHYIGSRLECGRCGNPTGQRVYLTYWGKNKESLIAASNNL